MRENDRYIEINSGEWDRRAREGALWALPISREEFASAKRGEWSMRLTPIKPAPREWFPPLKGARVLGLAAAGGQQCPIFKALGADITVFDLSAKQLETELILAEREGYSIDLVRGDMSKPFPFPDANFDLVFHPVSNCYVRDVEHVWREACRVLKPGGILLAGFANPCIYLFDEKDPLRIANPLPYDPVRDAGEGVPARGGAVEFSHSLDAQIGGQLRAGLALTDMYEDSDRDSPLAPYFPCYIATRAVKKHQP